MKSLVQFLQNRHGRIFIPATIRRSLFYDEDKRGYYAALQIYDESEEITPFVDFLRGQTEKTGEKTLVRSDGKMKRKALDNLL